MSDSVLFLYFKYIAQTIDEKTLKLCSFARNFDIDSSFGLYSEVGNISKNI